MVDNMFYHVLFSLLVGSSLAKPSGESQDFTCEDAEYYGYEDVEGCDENEEEQKVYDYEDEVEGNYYKSVAIDTQILFTILIFAPFSRIQ